DYYCSSYAGSTTYGLF
nr:immunoglobulin light chain junction region [Macaca mulatta]